MDRAAKHGLLTLALLLPTLGLSQTKTTAVPRPPVSERREAAERPVPRPPVPSMAFQSAPANSQPTAPRPAAQQPSVQQGRPVPRPPDEVKRGPRSGDWLRRNMNLSPEQQRQQLQNDQNFKKLPQEQQQRLMQRLDRFNSMNPNQKQRWLDRMDWIEHLPPEEHQQVNQMRQEMQQLDPSRRQAIRQALGSMRGMSADDQRKAIDSNRNFNDKERNIMRGIADMKSRRSAEKQNSPNKK